MRKMSRSRHALGPALPASSITPENAETVLRVDKVVLGYVHKPTRIRPAFNLARQRLREVEALIRLRHAGPVDTDDGGAYFAAAAPHLDSREVALAWARRWTPRLTIEDVLAELDRIDARRPTYRADKVARMLAVRRVERDELGLSTIGAVDLNKRQRLTERKLAARERERLRREYAGATPRDRSKSAMKPWVAEGISRAVWYRRKAAAETNSCANVKRTKLSRETNSCAPINNQLRTKSSQRSQLVTAMHEHTPEMSGAPEGARQRLDALARRPHDLAAQVADYLHNEGRNAAPREHRRVLDERWPDLKPDELRRALDVVQELIQAEECERDFYQEAGGEEPW